MVTLVSALYHNITTCAILQAYRHTSRLVIQIADSVVVCASPPRPNTTWCGTQSRGTDFCAPHRDTTDIMHRIAPPLCTGWTTSSYAVTTCLSDSAGSSKEPYNSCKLFQPLIGPCTDRTLREPLGHATRSICALSMHSTLANAITAEAAPDCNIGRYISKQRTIQRIVRIHERAAPSTNIHATLVWRAAGCLMTRNCETQVTCVALACASIPSPGTPCPRPTPIRPTGGHTP